VTDGAHVDVGLAAGELFFCHFSIPVKSIARGLV